MSTITMTPKDRIVRLFKKEEIDRIPCFSGMGNITEYGLKRLGYRFADIHLDATMMAESAATTYEFFGYECAVVPFDLCVEAEALGCEINVYAHQEGILYPTIRKKLINNEAEMEISIPQGLESRGRIPLVSEAIGLLKKKIGDTVPIGSYVLGPFTLAGQIMDLNELLKLSFKKPDKVGRLLDILSDVAVVVAKEFIKAGVDYLTVREMGATSDVLSPRQKNDLVESRKTLGNDVLIFGNLDPYNVLVQGKPETVREAVRKCIDDGASALWPGCDIWPTVPPENFHAMMDEVRNYKRL
jgi:[methyl-Co(III) methanol-specific corrinoid protein]:coenzyme M methyltransferase